MRFDIRARVHSHSFDSSEWKNIWFKPLILFKQTELLIMFSELKCKKNFNINI